MSFSAKPSASQLAICELPNAVSNNRSGSFAVCMPSQTAKSSKIYVGRNCPKSVAVRETYQQTQVQDLIDILRYSAEEGSIREAKGVHGLVLKSNFEGKDLVLYNHVAHAYSKCSDFSAACKLFDIMPHRNVFSWTVMIVGSTEHGLFFYGFKFFCEMLNDGIFPDKFACSGVIQSCIGLDSLELGKMVHAQIVTRGFATQVFVSTSLLNMYAKLGSMEDSYRVFNMMTEHNQVTWNAMISGCTSNGLYLEAFNLFVKMKSGACTPNMYTIVSVSKAVGKLGDVNMGKEVQNCASELGIEDNVLVGTALIDMYSKCGSLDDARSVFDTNFINCGVNTPWNAMISGYSQSGRNQESLELYVRMCENGINPDLYTYCSVFNAIAASKNLQFLMVVHGMVLKSGHDLMVISVNNAIADAYSKCGFLEDVRKVFNRMEERDLVSWTTLVTAYSQSSLGDEALATFCQMTEEGFAPNQFTLSSVLVSCSSLCFLEYGQQVHGLVCKAGLDTEKCIESALIDMYAKCGSITEAEKVFAKISDPDIVSWTAIISGYAQHGLVEDALQHFRRMEQSDIKANSVTLLCVLFACSHGGLVDEGLSYFQQMEENYGVVPEMEHYACIVDLLGRVGRLDDAMEFIRKMPMEPNEMVWQTLLGACRVHCNVELGKIAARKILPIRPENSATYVLLSNLYIESGSYDDGLGLRNVMKDQGVKKDPGYSWISVNGRVHKFYSGDQQHPQKNEIYIKLEELREKTKAMGYVPDLRYALNNLD